MPSQHFPLRQFAFARGQLDRAAHLREDPEQMTALQRSPIGCAYVIHREGLVLKKTGDAIDPRLSPELAQTLGLDPLAIFLGLRDGAGVFAYGLGAEAAAALEGRGDVMLADLRATATQGLISHDDLGAIAEAKSLVQWHARHRFCANCGAPSEPSSAGWKRECPACKAQHFPRTDPVVIMLVTEGDNCLLGRSPRFAPNMWSCLAGFVEPGESIEDAVRREVHEEAGIVCGDVGYFASQPWPYPSSLMIGCTAKALTTEITFDPTELEAARWFSRDEVAAMLKREHPAGLLAPHPFAIAHHLLAEWNETRG